MSNCSNCGSELPNDAKFCPVCGSKTQESTTKKILLKCPDCGGNMEVSPDKTVSFCPYCGSKSIMVYSDTVESQRLKSDAYKTVEVEKLRHKEKMTEMENNRIDEKHTNAVKASNQIWRYLAIVFCSIVTFLSANMPGKDSDLVTYAFIAIIICLIIKK